MKTVMSILVVWFTVSLMIGVLWSLIAVRLKQKRRQHVKADD